MLRDRTLYGSMLRASRWVIDIAILSLAFWVAGLIRFDWDLPLQMFKRLAFAWPYVVGLEFFVLVAFSVPRFSWRYVGLPEARQILIATGVSSGALLAVRFGAEALSAFLRHAVYGIIPIGVIGANLPLAFLGVLGVRVLRRVLAERSASVVRAKKHTTQIPTMLIGAGQGGVAVVKEIRNRPDLGIHPVGFLDDNRDKVGTVVHGVTVHGTSARLAELCARQGAEQVLVTIASVTGDSVRRIVDACEAASLPVKIIPALHEIVGGKLSLNRIRDVAIEDLLRREPVQLDMQGIASFIQDKTVMITGAGGSIGAEICRQVARFSPERMVLVERFETALFEIERELRGSHPSVALQAQIADICDGPRMERVFDLAGGADILFHAAAHKHVPLMEQNAGEAIKNNVLGTQALANLAAERNVGHFVMISTDKAVNPTSVMGASKRVAELYVQGMAQKCPETTFVSVRFGNVLGSNGSVIPIFKRQIAAGGPVTVTHKEMTRYFMTIPEATQLVLQAATLGSGGEVFILDMGVPIKIVDLARDVIRLSGFEVGKDIAIEFCGIRPGEKLFEEIATSEECAAKTRHEKIFTGRVQAANWTELNDGITRLAASADTGDPAVICAGLRALIPEFRGSAPVAPANVISITKSAPRS